MLSALVLSLLLLLAVAPARAHLADDGVHPPPATGAFVYGTFVPALTLGTSYVDPVFGQTVRRITSDHHNDDIYARNMRWNADETRYLHDTDTGYAVIDAATGTVTHTGIPTGSVYVDGGFDPVDPDVLYYFWANTIRKVTLQPGGTWTDTVYFTAPGELLGLGGTLNWFDANGRYMLVRYGPEPSVYLYDRRNLAAGPYANPIDSTESVGTGSYLGLTPDGQFVVGYGDGGLGVGRGFSWAIAHASRTIAKSPSEFWSLCGDHGSFVSASDGRNYMVIANCWDRSELWRVDITNNAAGLTPDQQKALPNNRRLIAWPSFGEGGHVSTAARAPFQDWAFVANEDASDTATAGTPDAAGNVSPWHAYRQEIVAFNVVTGEVRRLVHHRSLLVDGDYYAQPRLSASWGAALVGYASNFRQRGATDIYAVLPGLPVPAPGLATLMSPAAPILTPTPTYTWNADAASTWYQLRVEDGTGVKIQQWYRASDVGCATGTRTCAVTPSIAVELGAVAWRIQTRNESGDGPWSSPMTFSRTAPAPPPAPPAPPPVTPRSGPPTALVAAVLPGSRSVQVGTAATAFVAVINVGSAPALDVTIAPRTGLPASFFFQTTNPVSNALTGAVNAAVDIPAGQLQTFVIALTPSAAIAPTNVEFSVAGINTPPVNALVGINTLLFSASDTPVPDVVAMVGTLTNDGIVDVPGATGIGLFVVAVANVGAAGVITASTETGGTMLPITLALCQTDPASGQCISAVGPSVTTQIDAGATPTFAIFVTGTGLVPFDPAAHRIFVRFTDSSGAIRGATSVAVRTR